MKHFLDGIRISGYYGTWSVIDSFGHRFFPYNTLYVMRSDLYGDDECYLIIDHDQRVIMNDIWNDPYEEFETDYSMQLGEQNERILANRMIDRLNNELDQLTGKTGLQRTDSYFTEVV